MHGFIGPSVGGSKKKRKGEAFYLMFFFFILLTLVLDSLKVDHPIAAQSASSTGLKRLLRKRASDKVGKARSSAATGSARSKSLVCVATYILRQIQVGRESSQPTVARDDWISSVFIASFVLSCCAFGSF
jgi:hypothetical protein